MHDVPQDARPAGVRVAGNVDDAVAAAIGGAPVQA
jgi:shikimate kinase